MAWLGWDAAADALLKRMWADGEDVAAIIAALGGPSRNAVYGRIHRKGFARAVPDTSLSAKRAEAARKAAAVKKEKKSAAPKPKQKPKTAALPAPAVMPAPQAKQFKGPQPGRLPPNTVWAPADGYGMTFEQRELWVHCDWPIDKYDGGRYGLRMVCGCPCEPKKPYCSAHVAASLPAHEREPRAAAAPVNKHAKVNF